MVTEQATKATATRKKPSREVPKQRDESRPVRMTERAVA